MNWQDKIFFSIGSPLCFWGGVVFVWGVKDVVFFGVVFVDDWGEKVVVVVDVVDVDNVDDGGDLAKSWTDCSIPKRKRKK